jgi:hypothetical protein
MENYHVIDLVGEGSFGKVSNRGPVYMHINFMSLAGMTDKGHSGHDRQSLIDCMVLCRSTRGAESSLGRLLP